MKKCYLSKSPATNVSVLTGILKRNDVALISGGYGAAHEPPVDDAVSLRHSDIFIGILDGSRSDSRVLFEAGVAVGLEKPAALISPPTKEGFFDFPGCMLIKARSDEHTALDIHITAFLMSPPEGLSHLVRQRHSITPYKRDERLSRNNEDVVKFDSLLEKTVYDSIVRYGGKVFAKDDRHRRTSYRPDFFVSLPDLETGLTNNLVIEVKGRVAQQHVEEVEARLNTFLLKAAVPTGLILVGDEVPRRPHRRNAQILWLSISDFIQFLSKGELNKFIAAERNRLLHGEF